MDIKYRVWYKQDSIRKIKLEIPGWAGTEEVRKDGNMPQPWHCMPFTDASTYGLELLYPFETEVKVRNENGSAIFEANSLDEWKETIPSGKQQLPFSAFAPGHYGLTSSVDLQGPEDYVVRTEPHPKYYTDHSGTTPLCIPGHIAGWWNRIFFVVFKVPFPGQVHYFRKGEPYAQILILPKKSEYNLVKMTESEAAERAKKESKIANHAKKIAGLTWVDGKGNRFDDKYKKMAAKYSREGKEGVEKLIEIAATPEPRKPCKVFKMRKR